MGPHSPVPWKLSFTSSNIRNGNRRSDLGRCLWAECIGLGSSPQINRSSESWNEAAHTEGELHVVNLGEERGTLKSIISTLKLIWNWEMVKQLGFRVGLYLNKDSVFRETYRTNRIWFRQTPKQNLKRGYERTAHWKDTCHRRFRNLAAIFHPYSRL